MSANFIEINSTEELNEVFEESGRKPVVLFKHSLTCPISAGVYGEISRVEADIYLVVMQMARNVSNEIASRTGIRHESPQAIVLKNGEPVYHASHYDVSAEEVSSKL
ncbi:MAG TPA: bacillithiol system redox-active protein YtxJ [Pyrinomonadaceae bacterium]|nr:bacillithiol system redox-active protein YtxJ [Pyrinomonadaceae bacterium]